GHTDLAMLTREGYLFAWATPGFAYANTQWWHANHDERHGGRDGGDPRPPGIIRNLQWTRGSTTASWTAPGGNWYNGTVARYAVPYQPSGTTASTTPSGGVETRQTITVPAGTTSFTVQAVDGSGNLGARRTAS